MNSKKVFVCLVVLILLGVFSCKRLEQDPAIISSPLESPLASPDVFESPLVASPQLTGPLFEGTIAFHSKRSGSLQIYILQGGTGEIERLTTDPFGAFEPSWSPNCESIIFTSGRDNQDSFEIYTMLRNGNEQKRLFKHQPEDDWAPAWSPDGDTIAYQTNSGGRFNICFVNINGKQKGCLEEELDNGSPAWSPDGNKMLYTSNRDGDWEVYIIDMQGDSTSVQLTHNDFTEKYPQFSPDGKYIAFASERANNFDIFVMDVDGSNEIQLTDHSADDVSPHWVGCEKIAFASHRSLSERERDWDLYLMDRDGRNVTRLTHAAGLDKWPVWCSSAE